MSRRLIFGLLMAVCLLFSCQNKPYAGEPSHFIDSIPPLTSAAIRACPITFPNGRNPPNPIRVGPPVPQRHGNGVLWMDGAGKIVPDPKQWNSDGSLNWKMGWDRGIPGRLEVTGRRLDAPAPPAVGEYDLPGYGRLGFQAGGVHFPSEGCWELTGRVVGPLGEGSLRVVVLVVRLPFRLLEVAWLPGGLSLKDVEVGDWPNAVRVVYGPVVEGRERIWWGWEGGVWSREGEWEEVPVFSWGYGALVVETARRGWQGGPPNPIGPAERLVVRGQPARCIQSPQEDATALLWEEGNFRYRVLQWGLRLGCADLRRVVEGERH
jgi:hypothetical protein